MGAHDWKMTHFVSMLQLWSRLLCGDIPPGLNLVSEEAGGNAQRGYVPHDGHINARPPYDPWSQTPPSHGHQTVTIWSSLLENVFPCWRMQEIC